MIMFVALCLLTGVTLTLSAWAAYAQWRDALHPAAVTALPFGFMLSVSPLILNADGGLESFFDNDQLVRIQLIYFLSILCFSIGLLSTWPRRAAAQAHRVPVGALSSTAQRRLYTVAQLFGIVSVGAYVYMINNVGGFVEAYSRAKGGGRAGSGYIGEAILLSFPAVLAIAVCRRTAGGRMRPKDIALSLFFMSPHLIQGTFGGRRGPLFLGLATLLFSWMIVKGRRASLKGVTMGVAVAGLSMFFVWSQRQDVYIGSEESVDLSRIWNVVAPETVGPGDTYVTSGAHILSADYHQSFYWGYRYFVTFFIRPIPRQLWPTKYEDMGATWVYGLEDEAEAIRLVDAIGFSTPGGAAMPSIADTYLEFSWGVLPFFFFLGWVFAKTWSLHRTKGGEWTIVYAVMLALSVYLASQSVSAWAHRLLFITVPTLLVWRYWISTSPYGRRAALPAKQRSMSRRRFTVATSPVQMARPNRTGSRRYQASRVHRSMKKVFSPESAR